MEAKVAENTTEIGKWLMQLQPIIDSNKPKVYKE